MKQFCLLYFEELVNNFAEHAKLIQPCLEPFGRELELASNAKFPHYNDIATAPGVEEIDEMTFKALGKSLHDTIYLESNRQFRAFVEENSGRTNHVIWEDHYN